LFENGWTHPPLNFHEIVQIRSKHENVYHHFNSSLFAQDIKSDLLESGDCGTVFPVPIHLSSDAFNLFKHSASGEVSVHPCYVSPIFAKKEEKNRNVQLLCLIPGPKQSRHEMYIEHYYNEMRDLSETFIEAVKGVDYSFKLIFVLKTCDYRGLPDFTMHKQEPSPIPCHFCWFTGSVQDPVIVRNRKGF